MCRRGIQGVCVVFVDGAVAKIVYIYAKFKNGVLTARQKETGEWTAQWEDSFSPGVRIDCCLDCFEKFVDKIKKL